MLNAFKLRNRSFCSSLRSIDFRTIMAGTYLSNAEKLQNEGLNIESMNPRVKQVEYAVRGPIVIKAAELDKELKEGKKHPFEKIIKANIGDCHAMGQKPITFIRQLLAACSYPPLIKENIFPSDVNSRAKEILSTINESTGCYSDSAGLAVVRKDIAKFISNRDGYPCNSEHLIITNGASTAVKLILELFVRENENIGIMIPIPQYPLYSATIDEFGLKQVGYYLNEEKNWSLDISELKRSLDDARKTCSVKCLCVINPGNPTGQVLSYQNIQEIIKFAIEEGLFIIADEVYQDNVYAEECTFYSFKKVMKEMGSVAKDLQLASMHSCSKGFLGECGLRGGYVEVVGISNEVRYHLNKLQSAQLGSNVTGQLVLDCLVNPPKIGEPSYDLFVQEKFSVLSSLKKRARLVYETLNKIEGVTCNEVQGAMYAFPQIHLPQKAIDHAKSLDQAADFFYCMQFLEQTGICVVPGSGFRQKEGTYHFRLTILPPEDQLKVFLEKFKEFHIKFLEIYK
ncbi:alanine aminotransferase 2 [Hydra vulgaris]|uniref:alanine aminotransferase 2 n=1 Tax=Hydra vulgaris TaxID=6087 RepID=UPI001F5EAB82|nr:alanine aminotransferase 2 [Hydra vulgaris]